MRAQRAKSKSWKDDMIVAQGNPATAGAALGAEPKMYSSPFFEFVLPGLWPGKTNLKKGEVGCVELEPRAAAVAALPWAIIMLPPSGRWPSGPGFGGVEPSRW